MNSATRLFFLFVAVFCGFSAIAVGPTEPEKRLFEHENPAQTAVADAPPCSITASPTVTNPTCAGSLTGKIKVTMSGGAPGTVYEYNLFVGGTLIQISGATTATMHEFSGLSASSAYMVEVETSDLNCNSPTAIISPITLANPTAITVTSSSTNTACTGSANGTITASATGGGGGFTYSLSGPLAVPFQASGNFTNLPAGTYTITAKDANGCTKTASRSVGTSQPSAVSVVLQSQTNATCFGQTGSATFLAGGGFGGTYTFSIPALSMTMTGASTATFSGLPSSPAGMVHTVVVTDGFGCGYPQTTVTITSPPQISISTTPTGVNCNGGSTGQIATSVTGGPSSSYSYLWSSSPAQTTATATGLAAGPYTVTVTSGACSNTAMATVTTGSAIAVAAATPVGVTHVTCFGGSNGSVNILASGGTAPYTYDWAHIIGTTNAQNLTGVPAGTYTVTVKDALNCTKTASFTVNQPLSPLAATATVTHPTCNGATTGAIAVLANTAGGTPFLDPLKPYLFDWADVAGTDNAPDRTGLAAGSYTATITDAKGCTFVLGPTAVNAPNAIVLTASASASTLACFGYSNGSITATATGGTGAMTYELSASSFATQTNGSGVFSGLPARAYTVKATDANNCMKTQVVTINEPGLLGLSLVGKTDATCAGSTNGSITVSSTGGTGAKTFSISPGGSSNLTGSFTGLAAGNYTISVTDANSCSGATLNVSILQTNPTISMSLAATAAVKCNGDSDGALTATVLSGASGPFSFELSDGSTNATGLFTGLPAGGYSATVTASNGCTAVAPSSGLVYVTEPLALAFSVAKTKATCAGLSNGTITITPTGGIFPYMFSKDNGATFVAANNAAGPNTHRFTGLAAGNHSIVIKDANNCTEAQLVTVEEPAPLTALVTTTDYTCNGTGDGQIIVIPSGGTPPFDFSRSGGAFWTFPGNDLAGTNTHIYQSLAVGDYDVYVRDDNNCVSALYEVEIIQPDPLLASGVQTNVSCNGAGNGKIQMTATGGTLPFTFEKMGPGGTVSNTSGLFENLAPGRTRSKRQTLGVA